MSIVVEFVLGSPVLRDTLERVSDSKAIFLREDLSRERPARLTFWAAGDETAFEAAMDDDWTVNAYSRLATAVDRTLYRIDVAPELRPRLTYDTVVAVDGVFISSVGDADGWHIRARFPDRAALTEYHDACRDADLSFDLQRLYTETDSASVRSSRLTAAQREVLEVALDVGYFDIPRSATTDDIGDALGISGQAVSERLRRALQSAARIVVDDVG